MRNKKLNVHDRAAVDLLLDRPTEGFYMGNLADSGVFVKSVTAQPDRVRSVKQILGLLKEMHVDEPPHDLAGKTLRRVYGNGPAGSGSIQASPILRPGTGDSDRQSLS